MKRAVSVFGLAFDRLSLYLPIILTGVLALGTYWLVRNAPELIKPQAAAPVSHDPDFFMRDFTVRSFLPDGSLHSEISGREGRHFPDTDTMEVDEVRVRSVSPQGLVTRATANRGLSNGDGSEIQLFGDAVVIRDEGKLPDGKPAPKLEFRGDFLHVFTNEDRVRSHLPVTLIRGGDKFSADAMDYDHRTGVANLRGRVRGQILPPGAAGRR